MRSHTPRHHQKAGACRCSTKAHALESAMKPKPEESASVDATSDKCDNLKEGSQNSCLETEDFTSSAQDLSLTTTLVSEDTSFLGAASDANVQNSTSRPSSAIRSEPFPATQKSPYKNANIFSRMFFMWPYATVQKCWRSAVDDIMLSPLDHSMLADRNRALFAKQYDMMTKFTVGSLWLCILRMFWWDHAKLAFFHLLETICRITGSVSVGYVVKYIGGAPQSKQLYLWILSTFVSMTLLTFSNNQTYFRGLIIGCKTRVAISNFLYSMILEMKISSPITSGKVINFVSNDLQRFETVFPFLHYVYFGIVECFLVFVLLVNFIGWRGTLLGTAVIFSMLMIQMWISFSMGRVQEKISAFRDDITKAIGDALNGILVIKCFNWEDFFEREILRIRKILYRLFLRLNTLEGWNISVFLISPNISCFAAFALLLKNFPSVDVVTAASSLLSLNAMTVSIYLPTSVTGIFQINITFRRFIEICNEIEKSYEAQIDYTLPENSENCIVFENVSVSWVEPNDSASTVQQSSSSRSVKKETTAVAEDSTADSTVECLSNLNFSIATGEFVAVVGSVGSGKSSLLLTILDELNILSGSVRIKSNECIVYAPQTPWLLSGTVRENILMGRKYDPLLYQQVISWSCLDRDLSSFSESDLKIVGEKGSSLSGGQRARVCLARTFYSRDSSILLLDDIMSAVDNKIGNLLFRNISNFLQQTSTESQLKTCILVTHQLQYLKYFDKIIVLNKRKVDFVGSFSELLNSDCGFLKALEDYNDFSYEPPIIDEEEDDFVEVCPTPFVINKTEPIDVITNKLPRDTRSIQTDRTSDSSTINQFELTNVEEDIGTGSVSLNTYKKFFSASKPTWIVYVRIVVLMIVSQVIGNITDWWLLYWADTPKIRSEGDYLYFAVFSSLIGLFIVFLFFRAISFFSLIASSSHGLFCKMTKNVLNTEMSFFIENPQGRILNRFTRDQTVLDEQIGSDFFDTLQCAVYVIGLLLIILFRSSWIIFIPLGLFLVYVDYFRRRFLVASRHLKRLEAVLRSPIYSLLSSTLQGLPVVRSMKSQAIFSRLFDKYLDDNTQAIFEYYGVCRWVSILIDVGCAFFFLALAFSFSFFSKGVSLASVSQSLGYAYQLLELMQVIIRQSSEVENLMTSTERILKYSCLEFDDAQRRCADRPAKTPPKDWPSSGNISIRDMYFSYPKKPDAVLKGVSLDIKSGEKVALVGRTGAGKSSLIYALFRIFEPYPTGSISIDSVDTSQITKQTLRHALSIIPQEPVIFRNTVRFNLDPLGQLSDDQIWRALDLAQVKGSVDQLDNGLDTFLEMGGNEFSSGERQLICLARAILKNSRIVVIDEATANVDLLTTQKMQAAMSRAFSDATVCTIAHRLHTIVDYDTVVVLDGGRVKETGHPFVLMQDASSAFSQMVRELGDETADNLMQVARESYASKTLSKQ